MVDYYCLVYWIATRCRYQPPLPADQVKTSTEFDYEGGNATSVHLSGYCRLGICCDTICYAEGSPTGRGRGRGGRGRGRSRSNYGMRMDSSVFLLNYY